ncbi:DNA-binding response regulator [Virgibacillus phasianinus]|uniref:DNA-binding response regulator n=1 Tax=Virgibacillus phasianinus TaxID=2017483 RepID=A0A220TZT1_9BACI|nr:response regulator transcription factor [Virgibacillus phasianinus]ASK61337.1 DNA-binding response regulator [Virgibacillus phasianinus]
MKSRILVVDDEWNMRNLIKIYLTKENAQIDEAKDGNEALKMVEERPYDLMVLDIMLPDIDGWEVCSRIRKTKQMPILMLTARSDVKDRVQGLTIGADDYLVKPFAPEELAARVNALLRRNTIKNMETEHTLRFEGILINSENREVLVNGVSIELTPKEFDILSTVAKQPKRVFTREIVLDKIWFQHEFRDLRAVDTHVKNIREKLRKAGLPYNPIKTVWGVGYKFGTPEDHT